MRGLAAFYDPAKGNCARCHPSAVRNGAFPAVHRISVYAAVGAPRNPGVPANSGTGAITTLDCADRCVPIWADRKEYLRLVSVLRHCAMPRLAGCTSIMGCFHRLADVVRFYAERDTQPQKWYPRGPGGITMKFDDLPAQYRGNLDTQPPFDRVPGAAPALSEADIKDIVAFLNTLTDGYELQSAGERRGAPESGLELGLVSSASVLMSLKHHLRL